MVTLATAGSIAWANALGGKATRWSTRAANFAGDVSDVDHVPKFLIKRDARFFCIGSCFARNIEEHLIYQGIEVLSRRIFSPKSEWPQRANGFVNKFTTASIRNEVEWVVTPPLIDKSLFESRASGWIDPQLSPHMPPVSFARVCERRAYLISDYFTRLKCADVVVITLGLNEVWFDSSADRYLNCAPSYYAARRQPGRYQLHVTDVDDNLTELGRVRDLLLLLNPTIRIVVTVSPVPMSETFSGRDAVIANSYSKSVLRVAAEQFARAYDDVDYFPSYDLIAMAPRAEAYETDCLHVTDKWVGRMMRLFLQLYLGLKPDSLTFNEADYLAAHPEVEDAVRLGELNSGFQHWRSSQRHLEAELIGHTE